MKTRLVVGIVIVILAIVLGVAAVNLISNNFHFPFSSQPKSTVTIDRQTFHVQIARTEQQKEMGLSNTATLPQDQGMIFLFATPDYYGFWMRNMKFPLDILYIARNKIVSIAYNVTNPNNPSQPLPVYKPSQPADTVLEINGGLSTKYHFSIGDSVSVSL